MKVNIIKQYDMECILSSTIKCKTNTLRYIFLYYDTMHHKTQHHGAFYNMMMQ